LGGAAIATVTLLAESLLTSFSGTGGIALGHLSTRALGASKANPIMLPHLFADPPYVKMVSQRRRLRRGRG